MVSSKSSVFLFVGSENYLKEKALAELRSSLLDDSSKELDYKVFYGQDANVREILDYLTTFPFLASKKLVVIKDAEKLAQEEKNRIISYIEKPSKFTCLVLDAASDSMLDDLDAVMGHVTVARFDNLDDPALTSWIKKFLAARDKKIEDDAIDILKELQGTTLSYLVQELEKLTAFVGDAGTIKAGDVEEMVGASFVKSAFDIAWAIGERKADKALGLTSDLVGAGKKTHEIIGLVSWHLKRLLKAKKMQAQGQSDYSIGNLMRISRRHSKEFFKQVKAYEIDQIRSKMNTLLEADLDIKRTRFNPVQLLEVTIIRLCLG